MTNADLLQCEELRGELTSRAGKAADLEEIIDKHGEELHQKADRIYDMVQYEQEWLQEKAQLQGRLNAAEAREKKILATLSGADERD